MLAFHVWATACIDLLLELFTEATVTSDVLVGLELGDSCSSKGRSTMRACIFIMRLSASAIDLRHSGSMMAIHCVMLGKHTLTIRVLRYFVLAKF